MSDTYIPPKIWKWEAGLPGCGDVNRSIAGANNKKELPVGKHPLQLYSMAAPNGVKVTIMLEELLAAGYTAAEYDAWLIMIVQGVEQFGSGFVAINPNSKIPAMVDHSVNPPLRIFESGSILLYLADKFGAFIPQDIPGRTECLNWLFWQMASAQMLAGGFGHFFAATKEKFEYPINRYTMEVKRQLDVLDRQLAERPFIAGDDYTIADMALWPWYGCILMDGIYPGTSTAEFLEAHTYTHLMDWTRRIAERPAVQRGRRVNRLWGDVWGDGGTGLRERHDASDFD